MLHVPTEKQKKKYAKYLSENEEIVAVTGIGARYYTVVFTFYLILFFVPLLFLITAGELNNRFWDSSFGMRFNLLSPTNTLLILMGISLILSLILLYFVVPRFVHIMVLRRSKLYIFTNRRILLKDGIFSIKLTSAPYDKITHISVIENFLDKLLFNVGDIAIHTAGPTPVELKLYHLSSAMEMKNVLEGLIIREKHQALEVESRAGKEEIASNSEEIHKIDLQ